MKPVEKARLRAERPAGPPDARRILVLRLGALGDVIRTRFAVQGLRNLYPDARIDWLVEDRAAMGLVGETGVDRVVSIPRGSIRLRHPLSAVRQLIDLVGDLRATRYDLALDFHGILKSALLARLARIPMRVGYGRGLAREGSQWLLTHRVRLPSPYVSRFTRNAALIHFLGGEVPLEAPIPRLPRAAPTVQALAREPVVLHPGTSRSTSYKRWDPARYAELACQLKAKLGIVSLVTWGATDGERDVAREVVARAGDSAALAPETGSLEDFMDLLSRSRIFVGSDSGPMHLACLTKTPVVALFGPTDPVENAPFEGGTCRVVRHDVGCNPCRKGCRWKVCMQAIRVDEVREAVVELIAATIPLA